MITAENQNEKKRRFQTAESNKKYIYIYIFASQFYILLLQLHNTNQCTSTKVHFLTQSTNTATCFDLLQIIFSNTASNKHVCFI